MKMHDQNDALSDTPQALPSVFLVNLTRCFDLSNKYVYRYRTALSLYLRKCRVFIILNKESPYRIVSYFHPENSNERCSGTILIGKLILVLLIQ